MADKSISNTPNMELFLPTNEEARRFEVHLDYPMR